MPSGFCFWRAAGIFAAQCPGLHFGIVGNKTQGLEIKSLSPRSRQTGSTGRVCQD